MKKYMKVKNSGQYVVYVKRSRAQKVLETGRVNCGDCDCSCADCDRCALRDGEASMYWSIEITDNKSCYKHITDQGFEVSDLIDKYYKPAPDIKLKDGDIIKAGKRIITIEQINKDKMTGSTNPLYSIKYVEDPKDLVSSYCTYSLESLKWDLIDKFKEIEVIDNIFQY